MGGWSRRLDNRKVGKAEESRKIINIYTIVITIIIERLITLYPSHEVQYENYMYWSDYLIRFPWEWMVTFTTEPGTNFHYALGLIYDWTRKICVEEKIQVGYFWISSYRNHYLHFHLLMLGKNRCRKSLLNVPKRKWEENWPFFAKIKEIDNRYRACKYFAAHTLGFKSARFEINIYNQSLLKRVLIPQRDGFDFVD
jgi:hypothetical protein